MFLFFLLEFSFSLRFITTYPLYCVLVIILCGPLWIATIAVHEWSHLWMSRRILEDERCLEIVIWPLGGYTYCDGLSVISIAAEGAGARGDLKDDMAIAAAGPSAHIPMVLFWFAFYAAINRGDISDFTFRSYLTVISSDFRGFFSTLFEQACLMNILLFWFNLFLPAYPLDGGRLMTSSMLLMGVALNKAALLTLFVSTLVSIALFAWSIASLVDGIGITGVLTIFVAIFVSAECYQLYSSIVGGKLREHPLFGRDCYIFRDPRPSLFQMSSAARNISADSGQRLDQSAHNMTMAPSETDLDQGRSTQGTDIN
ncbi:hypothetical protein ACHAXR_011930 [Thalassiosira sp. AJA248-18]